MTDHNYHCTNCGADIFSLKMFTAHMAACKVKRYTYERKKKASECVELLAWKKAVQILIRMPLIQIEEISKQLEVSTATAAVFKHTYFERKEEILNLIDNWE